MLISHCTRYLQSSSLKQQFLSRHVSSNRTYYLDSGLGQSILTVTPFCAVWNQHKRAIKLYYVLCWCQKRFSVNVFMK
jgi:hypothetical protein